MNAQELRVGNWISNGHSHYKADANSIYDIVEYNAEFYPILITEEWLLKFGFEKINDWLFRITTENNIKIIYNIGGKILFIKGLGKRLPILYLHQLQNLYFALTNTELTKESGVFCDACNAMMTEHKDVFICPDCGSSRSKINLTN